jgi:hypothetical protein
MLFGLLVVFADECNHNKFGKIANCRLGPIAFADYYTFLNGCSMLTATPSYSI